MYGSETWHTKKYMLQKIESFIKKCLNKILKLLWPSNQREEVEVDGPYYQEVKTADHKAGTHVELSG